MQTFSIQIAYDKSWVKYYLMLTISIIIEIYFDAMKGRDLVILHFDILRQY